MRNRRIVWAATALLAVLPVAAAPSIEMNVATEREIVHEENGQRELVAVDRAEPGAELIYTVSYRNLGDEDATEVVIENAIPDGVVFLSDIGPGAARPVFSIDDGATFAAADQLTYTVRLPDGSTAREVAGPERYTHVRWVLDRVAQGSGGDLLYRARVK